MQQRLSVARAVLHRPKVLLLDEPYTGLDPLAAESLTDLLNDLADEGCTLLLTTHNLESDLHVGQRTVVLLRGSIVHDALLTDLPGFPDRYRQLVLRSSRRRETGATHLDA
jgi:heme exporter protein A